MSEGVTLFPVFYSSWDKTAASALFLPKKYGFYELVRGLWAGILQASWSPFPGVVAILCRVPSTFCVRMTICISYWKTKNLKIM